MQFVREIPDRCIWFARLFNVSGLNVRQRQCYSVILQDSAVTLNGEKQIRRELKYNCSRQNVTWKVKTFWMKLLITHQVLSWPGRYLPSEGMVFLLQLLNALFFSQAINRWFPVNFFIKQEQPSKLNALYWFYFCFPNRYYKEDQWDKQHSWTWQEVFS